MHENRDRLAKVVTTHGTYTLRLAEISSALGYEEIGTNNNPKQRAELQGAPRFAGLAGPMWESGMLRYEDHKTYADLIR